MNRAHQCTRCGRSWEEPARPGRRPQACPTCDPDAAARRAAARGRDAERLAEIERLTTRVAELEYALAFDDQAARLARRIREPSRATVGLAVRRLAAAQGRDATIRALLVLAAACRAWARLLGASEATDASDEREPIAA